MAVGVSERVKGEVDSENSNDAQISGDVDIARALEEVNASHKILPLLHQDLLLTQTAQLLS